MSQGSLVGNVVQGLGLDLRRFQLRNARIYTADSAEYMELDRERGLLLIKERIDRESLYINDNPPNFMKNEIRLEISESALPGARFLLEKAVDPDVGVNDLQSYILKPTDYFSLKLHSQTDGSKKVEMVLQKPLDREERDRMTLLLTALDGGDPPIMMSDLFDIDENNGEVRLAGHIDYEQANHYQIDIEAKDYGGLSDSSKIIVDVTDVNDNSPVINFMSTSTAVPEDSPLDTVIAILTVQDPDSEHNGRVHCFVPENVPVSIRSTSTGFYSLITGMSLDRETQSDYNIIVICADDGVPSLSSSVTLHLNILDVNDNAPVFDKSSYDVFVTENNTPGLSVFSAKATDADWNQNARVSYFLEDKTRRMEARLH
ncbi:hypothetical protein Z043_126154 [Scleropages formosus]|uniref:Cadherin domain-containing protein n=1 Tax=Scleropages formosus TaxID=113540 RepID=A0A0P7T5R4_SCLFO|nr:hypothetical protein Z043_126154 [Scleropages formosus]